MSMQFMTKGYGGKCSIAGLACLMTSYSLSMGTNMIKSGAVAPIWTSNGGNSADGQFTRMSLPALRDCATYDISVGLQPTPKLLDFLMNELADHSFHRKVPLVFSDAASGLLYDFDDAYVANFSLSVQNGSAAEVTLSFSYFRNTFEVRWAKHSPQRAGGNGNVLAGTSIMPYWMFGLEMNGTGFNADDVQSFSVTFAHSITPKFGCCGLSENVDNAPGPSHVVFSQAGMSYEANFVMYHKTDEDARIYKNGDKGYGAKTAFRNGGAVKIKWHDAGSGEHVYDFKDGSGNSGAKLKGGRAKALTLNHCYPDTYSPQVGSPDSPNAVSVSGTVYGSVTYGNG